MTDIFSALCYRAFDQMTKLTELSHEGSLLGGDSWGMLSEQKLQLNQLGTSTERDTLPSCFKSNCSVLFYSFFGHYPFDPNSNRGNGTKTIFPAGFDVLDQITMGNTADLENVIKPIYFLTARFF